MHVMGSVSPANESEGLSFRAEDVAIAVAMPPPSHPRCSDIRENGSRSTESPHPPPPPPPPLPPPPPPPPLLPLGFGLGDPAVGLKKKRSSVRRFFWKKIPEEKVRGRANLWNQGREQQHFQIDAQKIEELFGQNERQTDATVTPNRGEKNKASFRETKEEVSILDAKRAMNIAIFLRQFKRSNQAIVDDIRHGNSESFGAEPLVQLLKLLPETEEVKKLNSYTGDMAKLQLADSFVYLLVQVPSYSVRIESMLLKKEFPASCEAIRQNVKILRLATKELMCCEELHAVLHLVLQAGNILNDGGYAGNAVGFKLSSLLSLADTKANKPGMNLLHFVALEAQKKDEKLLKFPLKLSNVQAASRISVETLDAELQLLTSRTHSVEESIQKDTELLHQLDGFLQSATSSLCSLRGGRQQLRKEGSELIDFFCEDSETFRLDDCFSIFHSFCSRFSSAAKENMERQVKEATRRQRMQEEEQKRHSWPGGEEVEGAFALRCSSDTDIVSQHDDAESRLRSLLNSSPNPRARTQSQHRTRTSPTCAASVAAERDLSKLLGMSTDPRAAQRRGSGDARIAFPSASPKVRLRSGLSPAKESGSLSVPPETSSSSQESTNRPTATYLSNDDAHTQVNNVNITIKVMDSNQQPDNSKDGNNQLDQATAGAIGSDQMADTEETVEHRSAVKGNVSVVVEEHTLVPKLQTFHEVTSPTSNDEACCTSHGQDDLAIPGVEEEGVDEPEEQKVESKSKEKPAGTREEPEDMVTVWCVTGVCEASGESSQAQTETDQHGGGNQGGYQQTNHKPSEHQLANEKPVPAPISSQPVAGPRRTDSSLTVSNVAPTLAVDASEEDKKPANQGEEAGGSTNETIAVPVPEQATNVRENKTSSQTSTDRKSKPSASSKPSTKNLPTSKPAMKPSAPNSSGSVSRSKSVRTLTQSESQSMRRVLPIRTGRGTPPTTKHPEKPAGHLRSSYRTPTSTGLTPSHQRRDRPATAPSSQRSGPNSKESRDQKVSTVQGSVRDQNQFLQRKPSTRKPVTKPKTQTEEKLCVSKLSALGQGGRGGSASAPVTPLHKTRTPSSGALPHFARNTASSSFRRTPTVLAPSSSPNTGSPKSSTKDSSSVPSNSTRTGSPRPKTRTTDLLNISSPLRRSSTLSPLHNSLASSKGHRRNDSGSFSDKSAHSRDSVKAAKPSWR